MRPQKFTCIIILPKNMQNLSQILLISLLIAGGIAQSCANTPDASLLLQTGTIQILNPYTSGPPSSYRQHSYTVPVTYAVPTTGFQVAASIKSFLLTSQFANAWDFSVRGGPGASASSANIVVFITDDVTWTNLQVSYLISSRTDIILGSFIADGYIFESSTNNQLTLSYAIPDWKSTVYEVISTTEFAGIRTFLPQALTISFVSTTVNAQTGLLTAVITTNSPFELLYLTYYWWTVSGNDLSFSTFNIGDGTTLAYPFVGIDGISGTQIIYAGSGFNRKGLVSCSVSKCPQSCITVATCQTLGGSVSGSTCTFCGTNSQWNGNSCVCNADYYLIGGVCSKCPANSVWNGNACACLSGFNLVNGNCIACPTNSVWVSAQQACVCLSGFYMINGACSACPANSGWNGTNCVCLSSYRLINNVCTACSANQVWNGSSCVCASNFYLINGVCQLCPSNTYWNGTACVPICPPRYVWNGKVCVCQTGFFLIKGVCQTCDPNSFYDGQDCNCNLGYFGSSQLCTACDSSCKTCSKAGSNGCSSCPNGITLIQGSCVAGCGAGKVLQGSICMNCPNNCITCSDVTTCTQCAQNFTLLQQIVDGKSVVGCTLPGPSTPGSKIALTGIVVGNNVIYQGVTVSALPAYFLSTNCADCSDLFNVLIIPNNLGITYSIQYVLYSQYWFIVSFSFGSSGITPYFQFKLQLNFKYASYFTSADMAQGLFNTVNPIQYPTTPIPSPGNIAIAEDQIIYTSTTPTTTPIRNPTPKPVPRPSGNSTANSVPSVPSAPPATSAASVPPVRTVLSKGATSTISTNTLVSLFG